MSLADKIIKNVKALPESKQIEILDFIEWADFSLSSAMRGMEDEQAPYSLNDLKESFS